MKVYPGKSGPKSGKKGVVLAGKGRLLAPKYLSKAAKAEWKRQEGRFGELGLTDCDQGLLVAYCETFATLIESTERIQKEGRYGVDRFGKTYTHPWAAAALRASSELRQLAERLGLTPGSRAKLPAKPEAAEKGPDAKARAKLFGGKIAGKKE